MDQKFVVVKKLNVVRVVQSSFHSLSASSFNWNARDGAESQVWGAFGGQIDFFFVFSVTFGI